MTRLESFQRLFRMPPEMLPYIDLVATGQEIDLVLGLGNRVMTSGQIAEMMGMGGAETEQLLLAAKQRAVVDRVSGGGAMTYQAGNFYRRLTYLSMQAYEEWRAIPDSVRQKLLAWHLDENIAYHDLVPKLELLRRYPDAVTIHNRDILLLEEALEIVDAAELHVVVPCDCRTTVIACDHPRWDTCIRLDDRGRRTLEAGEGKIVSKEACREIVINADRAGLLHTGQRAEHGRGAILNGNCCPCCSYPIRAGIALGMAKQWPKSHYLVERDAAACDDCGQCIARCPFDAFYAADSTTAAYPDRPAPVLFDPDKCFGCGLCVSTCEAGALRMVPLPTSGVAAGASADTAVL